MSVSSFQSSTGALVGNNSTTTGYVVPYSFQLPSDLSVVRVDSSGNVYPLTLGTDYTVIQASDRSNGTVYTTTAWPSTNAITINRVVPLTQLLTLLQGAKEPATALTDAFDKLTYIAQQLSRNSAPDTITASGIGPYVLGLSIAGGAPYWVPQATANIAIASVLNSQLAGGITPGKLSTGGPVWDVLGNLTALSFIGNATTATTASGVAPNSVTPAGLAGSIGANAWLVKTSAYTAINGDRIAADTTAGAFTLTLPASPAAGNMVTIIDGGSAWTANNLTIAPNGASTLEGSAQTLICDQSNKALVLFYTGTTWRVLN